MAIFYTGIHTELSLVIYAYNLRTHVAEEGGSVVWDQPRLHSTITLKKKKKRKYMHRECRDTVKMK
jgi:hypothetical protein